MHIPISWASGSTTTPRCWCGGIPSKSLAPAESRSTTTSVGRAPGTTGSNPETGSTFRRGESSSRSVAPLLALRDSPRLRARGHVPVRAPERRKVSIDHPIDHSLLVRAVGRHPRRVVPREDAEIRHLGKWGLFLLQLTRPGAPV